MAQEQAGVSDVEASGSYSLELVPLPRSKNGHKFPHEIKIRSLRRNAC
jgi:hypothetical protein